MIDKSSDKYLIAWADRRKNKFIEKEEAISRQIVFSRLWICPQCQATKMLSYEELAEVGNPYCNNCIAGVITKMILTTEKITQSNIEYFPESEDPECPKTKSGKA